MKALESICAEENLDQKQFTNLIEKYLYDGKDPLKEDVFICLENRQSVLQAASVVDRIIEKMMEYLEVFSKGIVA